MNDAITDEKIGAHDIRGHPIQGHCEFLIGRILRKRVVHMGFGCELTSLEIRMSNRLSYDDLVIAVSVHATYFV